MKNRAVLFAAGAAIMCMGFSGMKSNSPLRDRLKQSGYAQFEQLDKDPGLKKWGVGFAAMLQQREGSPFYQRLDTVKAECLWLIETFDLRDMTYSATELHFEDTLSQYYFHDRTGTDTLDHMLVYTVYHVPLKGRLNSRHMDTYFNSVAAPFKAIADKGQWNYPGTISLMYYYPIGTRKPSRKKQNAYREMIRSDIANTIILYTMIGPGASHTSVQLPPEVMPDIHVRMGRTTVCF